MSKLIYNSANKIKFTSISEKYIVPRTYKAKLSGVHTAVIEYVTKHYKNTRKYRQQVVDALNYLTYCIIQSQPPSFKWVTTDPLNTMPSDIDFDDVENELGGLFLTEDAIEWDVTPADDFISLVEDIKPNVIPSTEKQTISSESQPIAKEEKKARSIDQLSTPVSSSSVINKPLQSFRQLHPSPVTSEVSSVSIASQQTVTPKEDLYIQPPKYPRFDVNKVWLKQTIGSDTLVIYTTLPEIPTRQNEISVTTNPDAITDKELMNLYPKQLIRTRNVKMYDPIDGITFDEDLGSILPIEGFTEKQVIDNIIQYPHLFRLRKLNEKGEIVNFYKSLEVDGELIPIDEVWDTLPESKVIPRDTEYVKEYIVRRYLLEESMGKQHKYKMFGTLDPFLTLFMPAMSYAKRGYKDTLQIVKQCVRSRISYKQSRNPILRRLGIV